MLLFTLAAIGLMLTIIAAPALLAVSGVRQYRWWSTEGPGHSWRRTRVPYLPPPIYLRKGDKIPPPRAR